MAGQSPYDGLDDATWRLLLAQGALLAASAQMLAELHERSRSLGVVRSAVDELYLAAQAASQLEDAAEAVEDARARWSDHLGRLLDPSGVATEDRDLLEDLRMDVAAASAEDPFQRLFDRVAERAREVYGALWREPTLDVGWLAAFPPRPTGPDDFPVTATTLAGPVVRLDVYAQGFGPAAYAALPSLFVHECVCHVPARQRGKVDNASPFAEGFVDWAASFFFRRWIYGIDNALAPAANEQAGPLDQVLTPASTSEGAARRRGRRAADRVLGWLVERGRARHEGEAFVAHLAVTLNTTDAALATKDHLVTRLATGSWPAELVKRLTAVANHEASPSDLL